MSFKAFDPANMAPTYESLQGHVRGFCTSKETRADLAKYGIPDQHIFLTGRGIESLAACLETFRGRLGWIVLAQDLRALGSTKRMVAQKIDELEKAGISILDISHPEDRTYASLLQRAQAAMSGSHVFRDRRKAKRMGRAGGKINGTKAAEARDAIAHRWIIDRIVDHPGIPWPTKVAILKPHFSESTLRRHYGSNPTAKAKK